MKANVLLSTRDFQISKALKTLANQVEDNYIRGQIGEILKLLHQA